MIAAIAQYRSAIGAPNPTDQQKEAARNALMQVVEANQERVSAVAQTQLREYNDAKAAVARAPVRSS